MPITRTALIDDDGTGTTGTVLNNAWYQSFCDAIDALAVNPTSPPVARTDASNIFTVGNQWLTASAPRWLLKDMAQAADARLFDLMNGSQTLSIRSLNDAVTVIQATPLTLTRAGDALIGRDIYEKGRTTPMGHWITEPFNAARFFAGAGTWTVTAGQVIRNRYTVFGKTLIWQVKVVGSTLSVANGYLYMTTPAGFGVVAETGYNRVGSCASAGTPVPNAQVFMDVVSGNLLLHVGPAGSPNFAAGTLDFSFTTFLEMP